MKDRFFEISSPGDMLEKAKRDFLLMTSNLDTDTIFNFFVTAYHVMDYVKAQGKASDANIQKFYDDPYFQMCNYICNKGKHLELRAGDPFQTGHDRAAVLGEFCLDEVTLNQSESYVLIASGQRIDVNALAQRILDKWEHFFKENGI